MFSHTTISQRVKKKKRFETQILKSNMLWFVILCNGFIVISRAPLFLAVRLVIDIFIFFDQLKLFFFFLVFPNLW